MLAVAMLNGFTAKTEARRISLSVSRPSLISAQLADVIATFYRGRPAGAADGRRRGHHRGHDRHARGSRARPARRHASPRGDAGKESR